MDKEKLKEALKNINLDGIKVLLDLAQSVIEDRLVEPMSEEEICGINPKDNSRTYGCPYCGRPIRSEGLGGRKVCPYYSDNEQCELQKVIAKKPGMSREELIRILELHIHHYSCEDTYYQCAAYKEYEDDEVGECNCGREETINKIADALLGTIPAEKE